MLAVSIGKAQDALPFLRQRRNPSIAHFGLATSRTYKTDRPAEAKVVFDQAKSKGVKDEVLVDREKLAKIEEASGADEELATEKLKQTNILNGLKLDQALNLAKRKAKEGFINEAQSIYGDILSKFPKNNRAIKGSKR